MELIFATNNPHKLKEVGEMLGPPYLLRGLAEVGFSGEIPEDHETLEENASQKAWYIYHRCECSCFADDTGLEVVALRGAPGVYSARYARIGSPQFPEMEPAKGNIRKLLLQMEGTSDRRAQFRTVISLVMKGKQHLFEGIVRGEITHQPAGEEGFGYDPVFIPEGHSLTFAEMDLSLKNRISHRARAVKALVDFLKAM